MGLIADQRGFGPIISGANVKRLYIVLNKGLYELALRDFRYIKDFTGESDTHSEICFSSVT